MAVQSGSGRYSRSPTASKASCGSTVEQVVQVACGRAEPGLPLRTDAYTRVPFACCGGHGVCLGGRECPC